MQADPADVATRLVDRYAELLGVDPAELVAGRGPGELLRSIAARVPVRSVAMPLPAPTEMLAAFPGCGLRERRRRRPSAPSPRSMPPSTGPTSW